MKIDRSRVRKSTSEVPLECQQLIERLQLCSRTELLEELSRIHSWTFGKCELLHWAQILDVFDRILGQAAERNEENKWILKCDTYDEEDFQLLIHILRFTSLLIEHSFSRHLYNSMEHLLVLLESNDMSVVLEVLNLLYMFSKRSNFITRLKPDEKECLLSRLQYLAENWGGKENGFGLADCCDTDKEIPPSATTLHVEFHREDDPNCPKRDNKGGGDAKTAKPNLHIIHIEHIDKLHKTPAEIMKQLISMYYIPPEKEMWLFTHVRLATHFADYRNRLKSVQARLQALSVMVYSNSIEDSPSNLLYNGLLEELVEVVELQDPQLTDIRCAALRTLTAIIHLDRNPHIPNRRPGSRLSSIIDVTGASQYHGFLPVLVRNCISSLTNQIDFGQSAFKKMKLQDEVSAIVIDDSSSCDSSKTGTSVNTLDSGNYLDYLMDYLNDSDVEVPPHRQLPFVDTKFPVSLTTALFSFLYHLASYEAGGEALVSCGMMESLLQVINWQGFELDHITFVTRAVRVIDLITNIDMAAFQNHGGLHSFINRLDTEVNFCKKDQLYQLKTNSPDQGFDENAPSTSATAAEKEEENASPDLIYKSENVGKTCLPQRAALLKSMLNFLKKAFQDSTFAESIRHLMEGTLPNSLKNIIANAEYYGPSLFLLATDVVTVYVYQEPALLSALQDNGLTDVVLHSLLVKEVPATREVLGSLPNVFSALCLNNRGLESFAKFKPFEKLFNILLSPNYLPAMRRRRSSEPTADTACNLGNAMDELMRHQPSLRQDATLAIIKLLEELVHLGTDPKYVCWRPHSKSEISPSATSRSNANTEGSSDEEEDDEEETSTSSQNAQTESQAQANSERTPIALIDYIMNAMKFIDAILSNNSTDDHCKEFVEKGGLIPLLKILGLPNLPVDCPVTNPAQAVASVCKSILNLAQEPFLFSQGLSQLAKVLESLQPLYAKQEVPGCSKLLLELVNANDSETAFSTASATPLLHAMGAAHGYVIMFVHICRTGQTDIRNLSLQHWGSEEGLKVLKGLADLYTSLVWESTLLLAYCSDDLLPSDCDFTREDIEKLNAFFDRCEGSSSLETGTTTTIDVLGPNSHISMMDIDGESSSNVNKPDRNLKYIKPLLGASSRLGRALAELFGLLVKLCVGSPIRQRRGQNIVAAPPMPSQYARSVATALNVLLAEGLDCDKLPPCHIAKCRLTFLICSVGFTSPMLFDERRYPYHLMLKKFVSLGGQGIFFKTFKWALTAGNVHSINEIEYSNLPEGTVGFLDAWLTLLEKMVNPKAILESPHIISSRPSHAYNFNPLKYLIQIHKLAFKSVMLLWGKTTLVAYGTRTTETLLTILRHIFRGEKIIKEKMKVDESKKDAANGASNGGAGSSGGSLFRDFDSLRQLVDMGFSREHAIEALLHSHTLEQATDYLLSNPPHASGAPGSSMDIDAEDDQVLQAIAISLGCNSTAGSDAKKETAAADEQDQSFETMINDFTHQALDVCLQLVEVLPETVHKVCELLVTIMKRNGRTYRDNLLDTLISKIAECSSSISFCAFQGEPNVMSYFSLAESEQAKRLTNYIHLYILFFEVSSYFEMKIPCAYALNRAGIVLPLIDLVCNTINVIVDLQPSYEPKWLAPCFLLLDAVSKVAICTKRKLNMHKATNRVWRWYDLTNGRWSHYSNSNNRLINEAYWNGEQSKRVTCGRKIYTMTFANMLQMNDETGNNRPISMTLMTLTHPSCTDINGEAIEEPLFSTLTEKEESRCSPVLGLTFLQKKNIVKACVRLMHLPIEKNLLHSVLQICVRFTRDFLIAKVFVEQGGVKCLLRMRQINDFGGFGILATILIRHALEEPHTLKYAMEKVIRGRTLATIPPPYKDLVYLTRQIGGAVTRDPEAFFHVANAIVRVDTTAAKGEHPVTCLPLKVDPPARTKTPSLEEPISIEVISDLLDALLKPLEEDRTPADGAEGDTDSEQNVNIEDVPASSATPSFDKNDTTAEDNSNNKKNEMTIKKPMLPKSVILKILADAVVSFGPIAKLITEYKYKPDDSGIIAEETSALAFIFDKILTGTDNISDLDCSTMCRMLIAALASSNHSPEAQITLVSEVKVALTRALNLPESVKKHSQVQNICGIISNMIDNCPLPHANRWTSCSINNIVKLMMRRGVFNDLAKITHYLDLSSPNTSFTANAALKPLESLSRTINQPATNPGGGKSRKNQQTADDVSAVAQGGTSVEGSNPHGEEIEDSETVEIVATSSPIENNTVGSGELDNALEEMMEQILDHRNNDGAQGYNDVTNARDGTMDIDEECPLGFEHERDATEELMSTDSGESDSNPSDQIDDEANDDNEGDDDNIDDAEENEDNNYDEDDNADRERRRGSATEGSSGMFRIATTDRDEDILMIQYDADIENAMPRMIRWNENGFVPIIDENNPSDHTAITHPLLMSRNNIDSNQHIVSRNQRTNRPRRFQYLFSPRNPNPPVILQRLLGPHDPHMANMMSTNNLLTGPTDIRESARVVVMDNFGIIHSNEEQIDFVDQSGYLFGPSLAATLSHVPPVLHWWNIESKLLDLESVYDCTTYVCNRLVPNLIKHRNEEMRNKKTKEADEEGAKKRKQPKNEPDVQDDCSQETVHVTYDDLNNTITVTEQNKENADEDIDGIPLASTDQAESNEEPNSREEDIDGIPLENSDTSNDRSDGNTQHEDIILSPLQLSFIREMGNDNSQSSLSEATQNAAVQTTGGTSDNMTRNTDDSNSRAESEIRTESESSNPFELTLPTLPAYIGSRCNALFSSSPDRIDDEDSEMSETAQDVIAEAAEMIHQGARLALEASQAREELRRDARLSSSNSSETADGNSGDGSAAPSAPPPPPLPPVADDAPESSSEPNENDPRPESSSGGAASASAAEEPGPSNANNDEEIPEGVDPSFLEALPPEMRKEVLEQHRILCLQQRIAANANANAAAATTTTNTATAPSNSGEPEPEAAAVSNEVSPEFLAALPPALQEEVLTQQRLERQRQAAARANPNEPVDAGAFFQTLQPSLRTMILSDMEDSQMSALPPDLAAEAQNLRRDWYARNREIAQQRFMQSNLSAIYRNSRGRRQPFRSNNFPRASWAQFGRDLNSVMNSVQTSSPVKVIKGRQLLDHEGLACLLVLLFTDDAHLNKLRLHRVIRNLCYHAPTREWIINALLSIIEKSVSTQPDESLNKPTRKGPRPGPLTSKLLTDAKYLQNGGHWLTIRMEAALGCAANVFIVNKTVGKKCDKTNGSAAISIHPQAAPIVCRNTLDLFTSLAKAFPSCLLPIKCLRDESDKTTITPVKVRSETSSDFWDVLLRLDSATKKGKSIQKNTILTGTAESEGPLQFEQTVFGKLLNMLASPIVHKNTQLTDNLLKLLSVTTSGLPELVKPIKTSKTKMIWSDISNNPPTKALNLAVNVITYKNCSEEGLEFITNLLLNLANSSLDMSFIIFNLLIDGAIEIGNIVESQIQSMLKDLKDLINNTQKRKLEEGGPSTSKGIICNRFTNEQVVVTASAKVKTSCELQLPSMVPLTSKSSSQVFFLRVLRVIVQIRNSIKQTWTRVYGSCELPALSEQMSSLSSLWETLSQCLSELEHAPDHHAVLVLQPAVEAFFLVHSPQQAEVKLKQKTATAPPAEGEAAQETAETQPDPPATEAAVPAPTAPPAEQSPRPTSEATPTTDAEKSSEPAAKAGVTPEQTQFLAFAEKHRTVLNQILRQSTAHLADGPFAVLVDHTRILDFDIKRRYFRTELERLDHGTRREETAVHVRRSNIFEDSFRELFRRPPEEWKNRFYIVFEDEEGQDAGGLLREWYVIISRDIFNPMYALFTVSPGDRVTYMINSASHYNSNHLCYYKFVGRVIAKAIYDNKLLECYFTRSFYKHILGIPVKYTDMESEDYSFYRGLVYLMENNINNLGLDLTFSTEISEFGVTETRDLIPNGRHIPVTEENKMEYVRLVCQMKMTGAIKQQLNSFLEGFYDIIPMRLISIFNEQELELLISGLPNVDIDDLKANTEYHKYQSNSLQIQWFWRALRSFDQADRAKFLQFVTGTSKVPLQGFGALEGMNGVQKFQIHRDDRSTDRLPSAHTCFNQLDLPVYETYDKLRAYLLKAIHECSEGFGFA